MDWLSTLIGGIIGIVASVGTMILEKGDDYELNYLFKDTNGNELMSGTWDPFDTWNSDEIVFGAFGSDGYKSYSHTTCNTRGTKIYYTPE